MATNTSSPSSNAFRSKHDGLKGAAGSCSDARVSTRHGTKLLASPRGSRFRTRPRGDDLALRCWLSSNARREEEGNGRGRGREQGGIQTGKRCVSCQCGLLVCERKGDKKRREGKSRKCATTGVYHAPNECQPPHGLQSCSHLKVKHRAVLHVHFQFHRCREHGIPTRTHTAKKGRFRINSSSGPNSKSGPSPASVFIFFGLCFVVCAFGCH